ncbi:MAG: DUF4214 domain-containing protein [Sulfitobacter sp.]
MFAPSEIIAAYYVGYYNRAPDPVGFDFWLNAYQDGVPRLQIANFFADQDETRALYPYFSAPQSSSPSEFVISVYNNLFNRNPDIEGLNFWVSQLTSGGVQTGQMIEAIIEGAVTNPDLAVVENKIAAALYWENAASSVGNFGYNFDEATAASGALDVVTANAGSIETSTDQTDTFFLVEYGRPLPGAVDTGGSFTNPVVLAPGDAFFGEIEFNGDEDWFVIYFEDNSTYFNDVYTDDIYNLGLTLFDSSFNVIQGNSFDFVEGPGGSPGIDILTDFTTTDPFYGEGIYYLMVDNGGSPDQTGNIGSYGLFTTEVFVTVDPGPSNDDFAGNSTTRGFVGTNQLITVGTIETAGDVDWFRISLVEGRSYQINLDGTSGTGGLSDTFLSIWDPNGNFIASNDDSNDGLNSQLEYIAGQTGIYFVAAEGFGDNTGDYVIYAENYGFT